MSPYPLLTITLSGREPFEVQSRFKDMVATERAQHEAGMPGAADAPLAWASRLAYMAARREKFVDLAMPFEAFEDSVEAIELVESEAASADPTQPDPAGTG